MPLDIYYIFSIQLGDIIFSLLHILLHSISAFVDISILLNTVILIAYYVNISHTLVLNIIYP